MRCSAHCMTLSVFRAGHHPIDDVEGATFTSPGYPAITQITFLACCVPEAPTQSVTRPSRSVATMLIDICMDGFSLHWRSAPLRRTGNYTVAGSSGSPDEWARPTG